MDGQCQDECLHRTDPGRQQERINVTFSWVKQHVSSCPLLRTGVACCLPTCAQGLPVPEMGNSGIRIFWAFWLLFGVLCVCGRCQFCWSPCCTQGLGFKGVPPAGHGLRAEVGGGIFFVTSGETAWQLIKLPISFLRFRRRSGCGSHRCWP